MNKYRKIVIYICTVNWYAILRSNPSKTNVIRLCNEKSIEKIKFFLTLIAQLQHLTVYALYSAKQNLPPTVYLLYRTLTSKHFKFSNNILKLLV